MMRSENFSFVFIKDVGRFMILRKNVRMVRSKLCKLHRVCLGIRGAKTDVKT